MTISARVETAVSAKASGFRYVRSEDVAVVSVIAERDAPGTPLRAVFQASMVTFGTFFERWLEALPHHRILLFAATPFWDQHNALSRRRGIWGREGLTWLAEARRSASVEISGHGGARFAGLAELGGAHLFEAADFVRTDGGSFLFVSPNGELTEERVRSIFAKVFPKGDDAVDWESVVDLLDRGERICVRVSGNFDDPEIAIDAFLSADLLESLGEPR